LICLNHVILRFYGIFLYHLISEAVSGSGGAGRIAFVKFYNLIQANINLKTKLPKYNKESLRPGI
jgi:hypothetical protein